MTSPTWDSPGATPEADFAESVRRYHAASGRRPTHIQGTEQVARLAFGKWFDESLRCDRVTDTTWNWRLPLAQ